MRPGFAREHVQPLWSSPEELKALRLAEPGGTIRVGRSPGAGDRPVVRVDTRGKRPSEPLLRNDLAIPGPPARLLHPRPWSTHAEAAWLGSPGEETGAGASSVVIAVNIRKHT